MKFLCGNCKAKYQIEDRTLAGRTLRMRCKVCDHNIVLRGQVPTQARPKQPTQPRQQPTQPKPRPLRPVENRWHVSVNDVPVGPLEKSEIAQRISARVVTAESLCWREGLDDWRPLNRDPELAKLLRSHAPPPPRLAVVGAPRTAPRSSRPRIPAAGAQSRMQPNNVAPTHAPPERALALAVGSSLGPAMGPSLGPAMGGVPAAERQVAPALLAQPDPLFLLEPALAEPAEASAEPTPVPDPAVAADQPPKLSSPFVFIAAAGAIAFGVTLAIFVGIRLMGPAPAPVAEEVTVPQQNPPIAAVAPPVSPAPTPDQPEAIDEGVPTPAPATGERRPPPQTGMASATLEPQRSAADQAILDINAGNDGLVPIGLGMDPVVRNVGRPLGSADLAAVVNRSKPTLTRCYESAIRGNPAAPGARIEVMILIHPSGRVRRVNTTGGNSISGLTECVERSVGRWMFPHSSGETATQFTMVFRAAG